MKKIYKIWEHIKKFCNSNKLYFLIYIFSLFFMVYGNIFEKYNLLIIGTTILLLYNILYSCCNIEKRILFLLFNGMIFTFLLDRPIINCINGKHWWQYFGHTVVTRAMWSIYISEIALFLGNKIIENYFQKKINKSQTEISVISRERKFERYALFTLLIISGSIAFCTEIFKYFCLRNENYEAMYTSAIPKFSLIIRTLITIFPYSCFAYLATFPKKKNCYIVLILYCLKEVPMFLLGARSGIVLNLIFAFIYIIIRNFFMPKGEKWISKRMIICAVISFPIMIIGLSAYNYIRANESIEYSPIELAVDFFYKQGTSFDTLCEGFKYEDKLKKFRLNSYMFGDIVDYIVHNNISQKLFGTEDLGIGNCLTMAFRSNSMAHRLSFFVLGVEYYLQGIGRGTSYIIEVYMDVGFVGVFIYNLLLGMYLYYGMEVLKKDNWFISFILIATFSKILLLPRYSASNFYSFLVMPHFWCLVALYVFIKYIYRLKEKM